MSSASKSKSKDKKAGKEQKTPSKSSAAVNGGTGIPASAYNPLLGTFHTLEASSTYLAPTLHANGRFRDIDDSDDHSGSTHGSGGDYDSASNNDSRSVESEEHNKDKTSNAAIKQEVIPGADNDKREKIRQKNERKHQRQKERRAQELHERCSGYLMSRKLEALAQQLVAMGFSHERATMALIFNEGRVEEAVAWLFEGGEDADKHKDQNIDTGSNLKIDISEELARIAELEIKFKCSKQDVERAIVTCEGDLEKAEENLRSLKPDQPTVLPKPEEIGDPPTFSNGKISVATSQSNVRLLQPKPNSATLIPQRRDEKDFNYTKAAVAGVPAPKSMPKVVQPVTRVQPKLDWPRPQQIATPAEKRWPVGAGSNPSVSYSLAPPLQVSPPPAKAEARYTTVGNEYRNLQPGSIREPVVMMQRPQSVNVKPAPATSISSSPPGTAASWYPTNSEILKPNGLLPHIPSSSPMDNPGSTRSNASWTRIGGSPTLAAASSLGLFSGVGSTCSSGSNSPVDWNASGTMPSCDYTNIDWSLDRSFAPSKQNGLWNGLGSFSRSGAHMYDSGASAMSMTMRPSSSNGNGVPIVGLQDGGAGMADSSTASSREWTSPFEGKDLFSLPRQFVSSPSL
uniref:UBA domain-containing protein n=1 Tax=Chenopodium quinoa TaxID=63459 RepID=A0A803KMI3_CHEQI